MTHWFVLGVNPDPWAIGPLGVGKRNGKYFPYVGRNNQLHAYKEAVVEELGTVTILPEGEYDISFWFWRRLDTHESGRKHYADATNLQKATEDALQGILFENDKDVRHVSSTIVEQSETAVPCVVIAASMWEGIDPRVKLPEAIWDQIRQIDVKPEVQNNVWEGPVSP